MKGKDIQKVNVQFNKNRIQFQSRTGKTLTTYFSDQDMQLFQSVVQRLYEIQYDPVKSGEIVAKLVKALATHYDEEVTR